MHFMLIRHFETFYNDDGQEKIKYKKSFSKGSLFINFIKSYLSKYTGIKKIRFYTSDYERTLLTSLVLSSLSETEIIDGTLSGVKIYDPVLNEMIDRDPKKRNKKNVCEYFKKNIETSFEPDTLYIYITHSSVIYNLFKCVLDWVLEREMPDFSKRIHGYSVSYISKIDNRVSYMFNKKIREQV